MVDRLGHQDPAALRGPAPAPGLRVVVGVAVEPGQDAAADRCAQPSVVDRPRMRAAAGQKRRWNSTPNRTPAAAVGGDHAVGLLDAQRDGLLAQHMRAVPGRRQHAGLVRGVRSAHGDRVQAGREHLVDVAIGVRDAVRRRRRRVRGPASTSTTADHVDAGDAAQGAHVVPGDLAAADDADPHRHASLATGQARDRPRMPSSYPSAPNPATNPPRRARRQQLAVVDRLPAEDVREVNLDDRLIEHPQRVEHGDRRVDSPAGLMMTEAASSYARCSQSMS